MAGDIVFNNATVQIDVAEVNVYGNPAEVSQRLADLAGSLNSLREQTMATAQEIKDAITELTTKVAEQTGTIASMRTFVQGLEAAVQQQLDLANASDEIKASVTAVFAGVSANTTEIANAIDNDPTT